MKKALCLLLAVFFAVMTPHAQFLEQPEEAGFFTGILSWLPHAAILVLALVLLFSSIFVVQEKDAAVIERFGRYHSIRTSGLNFKVPFIDSISGTVNLQIDQLEVEIETKTKDNVFVSITVSVQRQVIAAKVYDAHYSLDDPDEQMSSYVFDTTRAEVPKMTLDELFERKEDIATAVEKDLKEVMESFGYIILKTLISDIDPAEEVKEAMNKINASKRLMEAAGYDADARKITVVRDAEAQAQSKKLQGEGISAQREAIASGLRKAAEELKSSLGVDATGKDVMHLLLTTQYYDALRDIAANDKTHTVFLPLNPSAVADMGNQIIHSQLIADSNGKAAPATTA